MVGSVISGIFGNEAADEAADASREGAAAQVALGKEGLEQQKYFFDKSLELTQPQRDTGQRSLSLIESILMGVPYSNTAAYDPNMFYTPEAVGKSNYAPGEKTASGASQSDFYDKYNSEYYDYQMGNDGKYYAMPKEAPYGYQPELTGAYGLADVANSGQNFSPFFASPDYQFRLDEGQKAVERSAAARGGLLSGATLNDTTQRAQQLASGEYNNYMNKLFSLAGIGTQAASQNATAANNVGSNSLQAYQNMGAAQNSGIANAGAYNAQGTMAMGNGIAGGLGGLTSLVSGGLGGFGALTPSNTGGGLGMSMATTPFSF